jgi:hypothetical protein
MGRCSMERPLYIFIELLGSPPLAYFTIQYILDLRTNWEEGVSEIAEMSVKLKCP